ncbi:MAG: hypothetical protein DMG90_21045 [Acidobacteria bacterium]|nr:MAG: hypothetical protein DMG90_21045 [Acidobacteriota bacterium]
MPPYKEQFPVGSRVRVKLRSFLEQFQREWKYHHPISNEQLDFAGVTDKVKGAAFYHGGDILYTLCETPGTWHEKCLQTAT